MHLYIKKFSLNDCSTRTYLTYPLFNLCKAEKANQNRTHIKGFLCTALVTTGVLFSIAETITAIALTILSSPLLLLRPCGTTSLTNKLITITKLSAINILVSLTLPIFAFIPNDIIKEVVPHISNWIESNNDTGATNSSEVVPDISNLVEPNDNTTATDSSEVVPEISNLVELNDNTTVTDSVVDFLINPTKKSP